MHQLQRYSHTSLALAVTLGFLVVGSGSAATIADGSINLGGNATNSPITFFGGSMDTTPGVVNVGQPDTGGFSGFSGGVIKNFGSTFPVVDFLTLATASGPVFFDLQGLNPGTGTNAACSSNAFGSVCTPTNSSLTLTQSQGLTDISLSVYGISYMGSSATGSNATLGLFTSQAPGTISQVLAAIASPSGFSGSYSATLTTTSPTGTPEPGSFFILGGGLLILSIGLYGRKVEIHC